MSINIIEKQKLVTQFSDIVTSKRFVLIGENKGLKVSHIDSLRQHARDKDIVIKVMKNTLLKLSLTSLKGVESYLVGQNIIALTNDELTATKLFQDFITLTKLIDFKIAYVDNQIMNVDSLKELSKIVSREHLYARLAHALQKSTEIV